MRSNRSLGLIPYHQAANAVLTVGISVALIFALSGEPHPWIGFFIGAVPTLILFAWHMAIEDEDSNEAADD